MDLSLLIPAFIAGLLTFLAPCTLPLVPAYLGFISGTSAGDLSDPEKLAQARRKVVMNGLLYVIGFSAVFIAMGVVFGLGGVALAKYRVLLSRIGGIFVIFFALYMMVSGHPAILNNFRQILRACGSKFSGKAAPQSPVRLCRRPGSAWRRNAVVHRTRKILFFLNSDHRLNPVQKLQPGKASSSFVLGATFAFGWTPCIGPILGSILLLASSTATVTSGAILLLAFSLGLAIPFLLIALGIGHATQTVKKLTRWLPAISFIGGIFLLFLGILLVTDNMTVWLAFTYKAFSFINYEGLLNHL